MAYYMSCIVKEFKKKRQSWVAQIPLFFLCLPSYHSAMFCLSVTRPKGRHRKLWKDEGRWEHDKFREEEQAPKSREELIAVYGYDIRNGNGPSDTRPFKPRKPR